MKKNILIILGRYLPGYKGGGPGRSIVNLVECLGDEYNFRVVAFDRDLGDTEPYSTVKISDWNTVGKAEVYYVPPKGYTFSLLKKLYKTSDMVYLCGCFNNYAIKTLLLKRLGILKKPVVVAAMGLFSPMEFKIKYKKKKLFTTVFNMTGMFKRISWSVTSEMEIDEIKQQVKTYNNFSIAQDLPRIVKNQISVKKKEKNYLKVAFLSRISRKKNLVYVAHILQNIPVQYSINFSIYGPVENQEYWNECLIELDKVQNNVIWEYKGQVESNLVVDTFRGEHIFLFPTLGENYGHVIQEALSAGCPCILSNQTPWLDLQEYGVGKAISLDNMEDFVAEIIRYASMDNVEFQSASNKALNYVIKKSNVDEISSGYKNLFDSVLSQL